MKKYIVIVSLIIAALFAFDYACYRLGWYIPLGERQPEIFVKTEDEKILIKQNGEFTEFEIRGVNVGSSIPGQWSSDYAIDEETYLRWFEQISNMGTNTVRVYGVQSEAFYKAFYSYNQDNKKPLYLLQGVIVNDYMQYSHRDAFDDNIAQKLVDNCLTAVDVVHGRKKIQLGRNTENATGSFKMDISNWVIGYVIGIDFEPSTVSYTNEKYRDAVLSYNGEFLYTKDGASPFEIMLASAGDRLVEYETRKYGDQRLVAFNNYPSTDPFIYPEDIARLYGKYAKIDTSNIASTDKFISGQFASYHVYPFQTDLLCHIKDFSIFGLNQDDVCYNDDGSLNDYRTYFNMLNVCYDIPVVITEFGISTGRNSEHEAVDSHGVYSKVSEKEQGEALKWCWNDIKNAGLNGGCVFSWHDEWAKRSPNTVYAINEQRSPYWSDYQTNGQYFGILSFDPGDEKSVCYVDGDVSEWKETDEIAQSGGLSLSVKYDEKFMYFLVKKDNLDFSNDIIFIPIDTTQKTGSNFCKKYNAKFDREADFLLVVNGIENSRLFVQERYEALRSTYSRKINGIDTYRDENVPDKNDPLFVPINTLVEKKVLSENPLERTVDIPVETGRLLYGNANPESPDFSSLADFCTSGDYIEIKLPWQLLNFADPSKMQIHDDYYDGNYGIEYIGIDKMYAGIGTGNDRISLNEIKLKGWGNKLTYHERLKSSYYMMQDLWKEGATK